MRLNTKSEKSIYYSLLASIIFIVAGCGGGGSSGTEGTTSAAATASSSSFSSSAASSTPSSATSSASSSTSASESSSSGSATVTLASCISATQGKAFTTQYSTDSSTVLYSKSIDTNTLNGISTTNEISEIDTNSSRNYIWSGYYSVYSATNLKILGVTTKISEGNPTTILYDGYVIDLTTKVGESRSIAVTDGVVGDLVKITYTFEGVEQLQIAGSTLTTCRVSIQSTASSNTSSSTSTGKFWYAAGYGFWGPVKEILYNTDGTASSTSSLLTP